MSLLDATETVKILLPGLIALTALLLVIITFLLERHAPVKHVSEGKTYRHLIWEITFILIVSGLSTIFSLLFLLEIKIATAEILIWLTIFCILFVCLATTKVVLQETL